MKLQFLCAPVRNQYFTVLLANFVVFIHGVCAGWLSPALLVLNSDHTPLDSGPLSPEETSWLASALCLGGVLGVLGFGAITSRFGNRLGLMCLAFPQLVWWGCVIFANHYLHLVVGRFVVGITGGALFRVIPNFVSDIAQSDIRGTLGSISPLMFNAGLLMGFILGEYVPYRLIPISILLSVTYLVLIAFFVPETPPFLMSRGQTQEAYQSLLFYRTVKTGALVPQKVQEEFSDLAKFQDFMDHETASWKTILSKECRFGLIMAIFLIFLVQFSGLFPLSQFTASIFVESGSSLAPNVAAIVVAIMQIAGNCGSMWLSDSFGRKTLLLSSCLGTALSLCTLGTYSYFKQIGFEVLPYNWIPIISYSMAFFFISIGITSVPFTLVAEILPPEVKSLGLTTSMVFNSIAGFITLKVFPLLLIEIHLHGTMWVFSATCLFGMVVCAVFLPETKGKVLNKV